jgi:hypothetical protein
VQTYAKAWLRRGALRHAGGRVEEGSADMRRAAELDPACAAAATSPLRQRATAALSPGPTVRGADARAAAAAPELPPGGTLPCAAPGVVCAGRRVAGASEDGAATRLGLRSTLARTPGDVLIVEPPFAAVLLRTARGACCHACFTKLPPDSVPCRGCAAARFCSDKCAAAAASGPHARECGGAPWPAALTAEALLAVRVAARIADEEAAADADAAKPCDDSFTTANDEHEDDDAAAMAPEADDDDDEPAAPAPAREVVDAAAAAPPPPEAVGGARAVCCALLRRWASLPGEERLECALLAALLAALLSRGSSSSSSGGGGGATGGAVVTPSGALRALLAVRCSALTVSDDWEPAAWAGGTHDAVRVATALFTTASLAERAGGTRVTTSVMRGAFAHGGLLVLRAAAPLPAGAALLLADGSASAASPPAKPTAGRGSPKAGGGASAASPRKAAASGSSGGAPATLTAGVAAHAFGCTCDTCVMPPAPPAARRAARFPAPVVAVRESPTASPSPRQGGTSARSPDAGWRSSTIVPSGRSPRSPRSPAPVLERPSRLMKRSAVKPSSPPLPKKEPADESAVVKEQRQAREKRLADAESALAELLQAASAARSTAASAAAAKAKAEAEAAAAAAIDDGDDEKPQTPARMAGASA